jgi:hypothetical protein
VTRRLNSSNVDGQPSAAGENALKLSFTQSPRLDILHQYLTAQCVKRDPRLFNSQGTFPTESDVLEAIGWSPSETDEDTKNWEDEQWEISEVKDDLKSTMGKGAREWDKWCEMYQKNPNKALKK